MGEPITDGTGGSYSAKVTSDNRVTVDAINELVSSERSRTGNLFGVGTGFLTTTGSMNFGGALWLRNDATEEDIYVQKLIFGWNGGSTNFNRVIRSFIKYKTAEPTANATAITDQIENISKTGSGAVASGKTTAYKWDGNNDGMTSGAGGFLQIPNCITKGNIGGLTTDGEMIAPMRVAASTSVDISFDDTLILGTGNAIAVEYDTGTTGDCEALARVYYRKADEDI